MGGRISAVPSFAERERNFRKAVKRGQEAAAKVVKVSGHCASDDHDLCAWGGCGCPCHKAKS